MKTQPILFQKEMVRAILDGRKTQTRRLIDPKKIESAERISLDLTKYRKGNLLWVKETHGVNPDNDKIEYRASWFNESKVAWKWKPSIFMKKVYTRIALPITGVRIEQLQDISKQDAIAEGIESTHSVNRSPALQYTNYMPPNGGGLSFVNPVWSFESLWHKINGVESWEENPFVVVVEFRRWPNITEEKLSEYLALIHSGY